MNNIVRGEVWLADLETGKKSEQSRIRLALIISATELNVGPFGLVTVLPVTTRQLDVPSHVILEPPEGGIVKTSFIACDKVHTIANERLVRKLGLIRTDTMRLVEQRLAMILGLS